MLILPDQRDLVGRSTPLHPVATGPGMRSLVSSGSDPQNVMQSRLCKEHILCADAVSADCLDPFQPTTLLVASKQYAGYCVGVSHVFC